MKITHWTPMEARERMPEAMSVYAEAMGYPPEAGQHRAGFALAHTRRPAFRAVVALGDGDALVATRIAGPQALDLLERVSPRDVFARTGQMLHTVLLDDAARPIADVYLCCDEDDHVVLADGPTGPALLEYLAGHAAGLDVELIDLGREHGFLTLDGPYAWELLAELATPDVIGLPYLGFFHEARFTGFRAGSYRSASRTSESRRPRYSTLPLVISTVSSGRITVLG